MNPLAYGALYGTVALLSALGAGAWGTWLERKIAARMQTRLGVNIVGPVGLLQPIADLLKMLQKESIVPAKADRVLFFIAPGLTILFAFGLAALVPFGQAGAVAEIPTGVVFAIALGGLASVPVWMAGWSSHNKYALLGAMRAVAQGVSYGVPLVLSALVPVVLAGSLEFNEIVKWQAAHHWVAVWPLVPGLPAFVIFMLAMLAEANRIPFDIPEAESELVAGVTTEYSGMQFGLLYLAEYLHTIVGSALAAALFLGGWDGPFAPGIHWMVLKTLLLFTAIYWIRWTLLRFRADQLMTLAWKWLTPVSLGLVVLAAAWVATGRAG